MIRTICTPFLLTLIFLLSSCSPHRIRTFENTPLELPQSFYNQSELGGAKDTKNINWWKQFKDPQLNKLVETALNENYSLKESWSRLRQARALSMAAGSARYPQLDVSGGVSRSRADNLESTSQQIATSSGVFYETSYFVRNGLSFEIDLWRRAASVSQAGFLSALSSEADYKNTELILIGNLVKNWFSLKESAALIRLLEEQIKTSETLLELTQLRFSVGRGNALDVLQQRQQLSAIRAELPRAKGNFERDKNSLAVLLGYPMIAVDLNEKHAFSELPGFPISLKPVDILRSRPDLVSAKLKLQGAEYDLAAAFADRFPRLSLGLSYNFSASTFDDLFKREISSVAGNFLLPFIDGGRRRAIVRQKDARVDELVAAYAQLTLIAFRDVENALVTEKYQKELILSLEQQLSAAKATLEESRSRYLNGLTDYFQVTLAIQSVQGLERRLISEKRALFNARTNLYLAVGGVVKSSSKLSKQGVSESNEL